MNNLSIFNLLNNYDRNCSNVDNLAINTMMEIQIPVYNKISSLSFREFSNFLTYIAHNYTVFNLDGRILVLTLLIDAVTCMIKYNNFYHNVKYYSKKILRTVNILIQHNIEIAKYQQEVDLDILLQETRLMLKYAKRLPIDLSTVPITNINMLYLALNKKKLDTIMALNNNQVVLINTNQFQNYISLIKGKAHKKQYAKIKPVPRWLRAKQIKSVDNKQMQVVLSK